MDKKKPFTHLKNQQEAVHKGVNQHSCHAVGQIEMNAIIGDRRGILENLSIVVIAFLFLAYSDREMALSPRAKTAQFCGAVSYLTVSVVHCVSIV